MKKLFLVLTLVVPFLFSCSDDNKLNTSDNNKLNTSDAQVTKAFEAKYPNAESVKWESRGNYMNAEFINNQLNTDAWFNKKSGNWHLSKTELKNINQLPAQVLSAFNNSEYAKWFVDDIDYIERNNEEGIYVIEVKKNKLEYDLYFSTDGILIKACPDSDDDDYYTEFLPEQPVEQSNDIRAIVSTKYPGCRIIEIEKEFKTIEVEIIHENRGKEVVFNSNNEWLNTHYDVRKSEVGSVVLNAIHSSYARYSIDDIEYYETPNGNFYLFELEKGDFEIDVKVDAAGNII